MLMKLIILPPAPEEALGEQPRPSTLKQRPPPGTLGRETDPGRNHGWRPGWRGLSGGSDGWEGEVDRRRGKGQEIACFPVMGFMSS